MQFWKIWNCISHEEIWVCLWKPRFVCVEALNEIRHRFRRAVTRVYNDIHRGVSDRTDWYNKRSLPFYSPPYITHACAGDVNVMSRHIDFWWGEHAIRMTCAAAYLSIVFSHRPVTRNLSLGPVAQLSRSVVPSVTRSNQNSSRHNMTNALATQYSKVQEHKRFLRVGNQASYAANHWIRYWRHTMGGLLVVTTYVITWSTHPPLRWSSQTRMRFIKEKPRWAFLLDRKGMITVS